MKKLFFLFSALALMLSSCAKDNVTMPQPEGSNLVSFKVSSPEMQTRYGEGTTANKLMWAVYFEGNLLEDVSALTLDEAQEINLSTEVVLDLVNGLTYDILFWAQAEDAPYAFDGKNVTIDYASLTANEEKYDAFFKNYKAVIDDSTPHSVELKRPFAQLNIGTGDIDKAEKAGFILENTSITVETCTVLDLVTGVASEPKEMTFAMNTKSDDTYKEYEIIALNYLLVNSEKEFIDVTFEAEGSGDSINREYLNVPIQRNHRTYILGDLLTKSSMFEVFINPIFDDEDLFPEYAIYYTTSNEEIVNLNWSDIYDFMVPTEIDIFGANIISNIYKNGQGKITFDGPITKIGNHAFGRCEELISITIPEGVTHIEDGAFAHCRSLTSITLPNSLTEIGTNAFVFCSNLTDIDIPDNVTNIANRAFCDCSSLTSIDIPNGVTEIRDETFTGCSHLINITIPDSVTTIGYFAFGWCTSLTNITIPDSVTEIGMNAFQDCSKLATINIPTNITHIRDFAFAKCRSLTGINIPNGVIEIGFGAFMECHSLISIDIPDGVTTIGREAFYFCENLQEIYCKPATPPTAIYEYSWSAFGYNASNLVIYVPTESVDAYKEADGWSDYADAITDYNFE